MRPSRRSSADPAVTPARSLPSRPGLSAGVRAQRAAPARARRRRVPARCRCARPTATPCSSGPAPTSWRDALDLDLLAALEATGPSATAARPGSVVTVPVLPDEPSAPARAVLLVGVGRHTPDELRRAGAALARATRDRDSVATSVRRARPNRRGARGVRRRPDARLVRLPLALAAAGARPVGRVVLAGLTEPRAAGAGARPGARGRRRRLAGPDAGLGAVQPQEPRLAGRAGRRWPARSAGLDVKVWDEQQLAAEGFGGIARRRPRRGHAAPARRAGLHARGRGGRSAPARGPGRQGHHLRHRRPLDQAGRGDDQHEARHDRRRRRRRGHGRARRRRLPGAGHRPGRRGRERRRRRRDAPRRRASATTAGAPPRSPTPTPRAGWCSPTRWPTPWTKLDPDGRGRRGHPDRRDEGRARASSTGGFFANRRRRWPPRLDAAGAAAGEPLWRLPLVADYEDKLPPRSPTPTTPPAAAARSPRRCSCSTSSATSRGPTSTSRRSATRRRTATSGPRGRPASGPGPCCAGSARGPPGGESDEGSDRPLVACRRARTGVEQELAAYVADTSHARSPAWTGCGSRPGGCGRGSGSRAATSSPTDEARAAFQAAFDAGAADVAGLADRRQRPGPDRAVRRRGGRRGRRQASRAVPAPERLQASLGLRRPVLLGDEQAVADGQQRRHAASSCSRDRRGPARGSRPSPRRAGPGRRPGRATGRCRRPRRRRGAAAAAPRSR